jgi:hypothetical protein
VVVEVEAGGEGKMIDGVCELRVELGGRKMIRRCETLRISCDQGHVHHYVIVNLNPRSEVEALLYERKVWNKEVPFVKEILRDQEVRARRRRANRPR